MEWERARQNGGRGSAHGHRRHDSPAGPPHPREGPPPPASSSSYAQHSMYDRHAHSPSSSSRTPYAGSEEQRPAGYPTPYGYAPLPPAVDAARRYESSSSRDDQRESNERRASGGSPKVENGKSVSTSTPRNSKASAKKEDAPGSPPAKGKEAAVSTPVAAGKRKAETSASGTGSGKKERKTSASSSAKEKTPKGKANGVKAAAAAEENGSKTSSPAAAPSREVDEDYDEGVDALMGLANAGSASNGKTASPPAASILPAPAPAPAPPPVSAPAPAFAPVVEKQKSAEAVPEAVEIKQEEAAINPKKRTAEETTEGQGDSKKSKASTEPDMNGDGPPPPPPPPAAAAEAMKTEQKDATPAVVEEDKVGVQEVLPKKARKAPIIAEEEAEEEEGEVKEA